MNKKNVNYEKMYYGFPVILVSFYDKEGIPNVTTISSSYTLKDMVALGFSSKGYAINQIKEVTDFVINIPDNTLLSEMDYCGKNSGYECKKFDNINLTPIKSQVINAPIIKECPISIECSLTDVMEREAYHGITNILATIKGRLVSEDYLDSNNRLIPNKFENVIYIGDGVNRGYRDLKEIE